MDGAKSLDVQHLWTRRRSGSGTITQFIVEQERSVSAPVFSWHRAATPMCPVTANPISESRELGERRAEVGGGVVRAGQARVASWWKSSRTVPSGVRSQRRG